MTVRSTERGFTMISSETIRTRMQIARSFTEEETRKRFDLLREQELKRIPEDDPDREETALNRALLQLRKMSWVSGCMVTLGTDPFFGGEGDDGR